MQRNHSRIPQTAEHPVSILKQNQLITKPYKPRRQRTYVQFQREHPDSLWQTDIKYYGDRYLIAFLDDCSRYLTGLALLKEATASKILNLLDATLRLGRNPSQILRDHGTQFYTDDGKSRFTQFCEEHGIQHILGSGKTDHARKDRTILPNLHSLLSQIQQPHRISTILQPETPLKPKLLNSSRSLHQTLSLQNALDSRNRTENGSIAAAAVVWACR